MEKEALQKSSSQEVKLNSLIFNLGVYFAPPSRQCYAAVE